MEKKKLYFAASLFNLADKYFNAELSDSLSEYFEVLLPQRLGFEFSNLHSCLEEVVEKEEVEDVVNNLIYFLDLGFLLPNCDFCLARLDEPSDEGVISEIGHARKMRIPVIGYRTDVRTPYGSKNNEVRGAHFFPCYDCTSFINFSSGKNETPKNGREEIKSLADLIYKSSESRLDKGKQDKDVNYNSGISYIGSVLFQGIEDLHSKEGLKEVVRRYADMKQIFGSLNSVEIIHN